METGNNGKAHTRKRGTRSENKENVNNADWRELKSYTSHEVRIFLTANLSGIVSPTLVARKIFMESEAGMPVTIRL